MKKPLIKMAKNAAINLLWVAMFLPLWPIEDHFLFRIFSCYFGAWLLAIFQVLFEEN